MSGRKPLNQNGTLMSVRPLNTPIAKPIKAQTPKLRIMSPLLVFCRSVSVIKTYQNLDQFSLSRFINYSLV